jgi:xanthine/CO dehydrogenase XdhC/CoxF family maturation factor
MDVYEELLRLRKLGQKCAIATIVQVRGSIPSYESAKLLVREDGSMIGTIGGGCVEAEVWNAAREVIEKEQPAISARPRPSAYHPTGPRARRPCRPGIRVCPAFQRYVPQRPVGDALRLVGVSPQVIC